MEKQTILDMCQAHNVKVTIDCNSDEFVVIISSRNTRNVVERVYRYKVIDIEASGISIYEYLRQRIVLEIAKNF